MNKLILLFLAVLLSTSFAEEGGFSPQDGRGYRTLFYSYSTRSRVEIYAIWPSGGTRPVATASYNGGAMNVNSTGTTGFPNGVWQGSATTRGDGRLEQAVDFYGGSAGSQSVDQPIVVTLDGVTVVNGLARHGSSTGSLTSATPVYTPWTAAPTGVTITAQPSPATVTAPTGNTFSVTVTGTRPISYGFYRTKGGTSESLQSVQTVSSGNAYDTATVTFSTGATSGADDGWSYGCGFTNSVTTSALFTTDALLTVHSPPAITTQPTSRTVTSGTSATFTVVASGDSPMTYQWQRTNGGATYSNIDGATSASYTPATLDQQSNGSYRCVVTNSYGTVTSTGATLTVTNENTTGAKMSSIRMILHNNTAQAASEAIGERVVGSSAGALATVTAAAHSTNSVTYVPTVDVGEGDWGIYNSHIEKLNGPQAHLRAYGKFTGDGGGGFTVNGITPSNTSVDASGNWTIEIFLNDGSGPEDPTTDGGDSQNVFVVNPSDFYAPFKKALDDSKTATRQESKDDFYHAMKDALGEEATAQADAVNALPLSGSGEAIASPADVGPTDVQEKLEALATSAETARSTGQTLISSLSTSAAKIPTSFGTATQIQMGTINWGGGHTTEWNIDLASGDTGQWVSWFRQACLFVVTIGFIFALIETVREGLS